MPNSVTVMRDTATSKMDTDLSIVVAYILAGGRKGRQPKNKTDWKDCRMRGRS